MLRVLRRRLLVTSAVSTAIVANFFGFAAFVIGTLIRLVLLPVFTAILATIFAAGFLLAGLHACGCGDDHDGS